MSDTGVGYAVSDAVARITLDRPPVNALNIDMIRAIVAALRRAAADDDARAVVLASAVPRRFCAGLDLTLLLGKSSKQVRELLQELYVALHDVQYNLGKPSIAAVGGAARGGGMTLAISCDVILAGKGATFGYPEINIGVLPAIHFAHLPRIVGRHRAFELLFSGRTFDAQEAFALGLVSKIVADAELDAAARALAADFAAKSPTVMRLGRAAFMRQNDDDDRRRIANAVEDFCNAVATDAAQEGIRAFLEKRRRTGETQNTIGETTMNLQLSIGITNNPRTWPVLDGTVKPDGIDLIPSVVHPSELFWRQLHFAEFDVSEMSCSSFMIVTGQGDRRFVGLPIFTTRRFYHTFILVRRQAGIETPADLKGKRVGVPEYQQTAALWARGVLQHEFGVHPRDIEFWMERTPEKSHGGATGFKPPPGVTVNQIPADRSMGSMLMAGELDAALHYLSGNNLVDRSRADLINHPDFKYLFADSAAEGIRYYRKTGIFPINHQAVVKRDIYEKEPWVAQNILKAFVAANDIANARRQAHVEYHLATGLLSGDAKTPLVTHGLKANRKVIETIAQYSQEQGLTQRRIKIDELYAPSVLES